MRAAYPHFDPLFRGGHWQTLAGAFWKRPDPAELSPVLHQTWETVDGASVFVQIQQPRRDPVGHLVMLHGLEGSANAGYLRSLSAFALRSGYAVMRVNMRTCGGSDFHARSLYHAGLTADMNVILRRWSAEGRRPLFGIGYSLGGNVMWKLAGELGDEAKGLLAGVVAISTPLELRSCVDRLEHSENRIYELRFLNSMRSRLRRRREVLGHLPVPWDRLESIRSLRQFDEEITAPCNGFSSSTVYYDTQSAMRYVSRIRIPALLLNAADDPLVPAYVARDPALSANPAVQVWDPPHGGHVGFLSRQGYRFWCDPAVLAWVESIRAKRRESAGI